MTQGGEGPGLALEPSESIKVAREQGRQHLDRDRPVESCIPTTIDLAHAARAQHSLDLERTDSPPERGLRLFHDDLLGDVENRLAEEPARLRPLQERSHFR